MTHKHRLEFPKVIEMWARYCRWRERSLPLWRRAEFEAGRLLKAKGYRILARNLRTKTGEIDLLCMAPGAEAVVVVEVKSGTQDHPRPEDHVNYHKQKKLTQLATELMNRYELESYLWRFDVVAVVWPKSQAEPERITHLQNAFAFNYS